MKAMQFVDHELAFSEEIQRKSQKQVGKAKAVELKAKVKFADLPINKTSTPLSAGNFVPRVAKTTRIRGAQPSLGHVKARTPNAEPIPSDDAEMRSAGVLRDAKDQDDFRRMLSGT